MLSNLLWDSWDQLIESGRSRGQQEIGCHVVQYPHIRSQSVVSSSLNVQRYQIHPNRPTRGSA